MNFRRLLGLKRNDLVFTDLTGDWKGHYEQHDARKRIEATLFQNGINIRGHMRDIDTSTTKSLYKAAAQEGLPPGADETLDRQIRELLPNAGRGPIIVRSVLPSDAVLEGSLNGEFIRFTKTYQGESFHGYEIGKDGIGCKTPGHSVEYSGRVSRDLLTITGHWTIYQQESQRGFFDGPFELRRVVPDRRS